MKEIMKLMNKKKVMSTFIDPSLFDTVQLLPQKRKKVHKKSVNDHFSFSGVI